MPSPVEHLSKDPSGKWKKERKRQRAALKDEKVYLQNLQKEKGKKKRSKCGWWGRRAAKKRPPPEVVQKSQSMPSQKKKTKTNHNYDKKNKVCGRANPFPTLDLTAKVRH